MKGGRRQEGLSLLGLALAVGLALRLISSFFVYGPQALDDYKHGVLPAYQWVTGLTVDLPEYRSFLLVWLLGGFMKIGSVFGALTPLSQVRAMYAGLALVSLVSFWGAFRYSRQFQNPDFGRWFLVLLAIYPLMPFVSTRAFGEAVALPFVLSGLALAECGRRGLPTRAVKDMALGLFLLGIATFFRFQAGVLFVAYALILVFEKRGRLVAVALAVGLALLLFQAAIDLLSGRPAFATLLSYLKANEGGAAQYGASPWYMTWLFVLGLTLFPFSLVFVPEVKAMWRRHWRLLLPGLAFVALHSVMPHKEERFMYPIVGLVLLALSDVLAFGFRRPVVKKIYLPVMGVMTFLGLTVACFNNTQVGEVGVPARVSSRFPGALYLDRNSLLAVSRVKDFFVRPPSRIEEVNQGLTPEWVGGRLQANPDLKAAVILTSDPLVQAEVAEFAGVAGPGFRCGDLEAAHSLVDRFLFAMNPRHNQRRRPTWYVICEREG